MQRPISYRNLLLRRSMASLLALTFSVPGWGQTAISREPQATSTSEAENAYRSALAQHALSVRQANEVPNSWLMDEAKGIKTWNAQRGQPGGPNEDFDMYTDTPPVYIRQPSIQEMETSKSTYDLAMQYYGHQGLKRFFGAFIESGSSYADGEEWNTQRWIGMKIKSLYQKLFKKTAEADIVNLRFGVNIHEIDINHPETIQPTVDLVKEAWSRGISPTLSMLFFPSLKQWEVRGADGKVDPTRSYLVNPKFPEDSGKIAEAVLKAVFRAADEFNAENSKLPADKRLPEAKVAINPVNEPETLAGFTGQFWAGAFAKWNDPNAFKLYVPSIIGIAKANVSIRMAAEKVSGGRRLLFFHNEAMTPKDYPSHKGDGQFAVSKLMLGDDDLMTADLNKLMTEPLESIQARFEANKAQGKTNVVEWCILAASNVPANKTAEQRNATRAAIVRQLGTLKNMHLNYAQMTAKYENGKQVKPGKTAKTDTIMMLDYYQQSEFILPKSVPEMIKDFSANNGELLKKIIQVQDDKGFLKVLEEKARLAEQITGQKFWYDWQSSSQIDFEKFLSQEDSIILDKLIGLRNEWASIKDPVYVSRRQAVGISEDLMSFNKTDEWRDDELLNNLLADDAKLLKSTLGVTTNAQLLQALQAAGMDTQHGGPQVQIQGNETVREILNKSERTVLHRLFGLERFRRNGFLPPHYARQTRAQMRKGVFETFVNYVNELGIRAGGIGESGTPYFPWAALVHKQVMIAMTSAARKLNFYMIRYDLGPLVGAIGWMNGPLIGSIKTNARRATDGIMKLVRRGPNDFDYEMSAWPGQEPWFLTFKNELLNGLGRAQARVNEARAAAQPVGLSLKDKPIENIIVQLANKRAQSRPKVQCSKFRADSGS